MKYYDIHPLLDRAKFINISKGARGTGKTFQAQLLLINDWRKKGVQSMWLRRYKTELTPQFRDTFFNNIKAIAELPESDLKPDEKEFIRSMSWELKNNKIFINGEVAGYYNALSTATAKKSIGFPKVDRLHFDEFLLKRGDSLHYLPDEFVTFLDFINTVSRYRNTFKAFLWGNNLTQVDPYTLGFNIPITTKRFTIVRNRANGSGNVLYEYYTDPAYSESVYNTIFGQIIEGTAYADYAVENKVLGNNDDFIEPRAKGAEWLCGIKFKSFTIGFWIDKYSGLIYADNIIDRTSTQLYSLTRDDLTYNTYLIQHSKSFACMRIIKNAFSSASMRFKNAKIKNICYEMLAIL